MHWRLKAAGRRRGNHISSSSSFGPRVTQCTHHLSRCVDRAAAPRFGASRVRAALACPPRRRAPAATARSPRNRDRALFPRAPRKKRARRERSPTPPRNKNHGTRGPGVQLAATGTRRVARPFRLATDALAASLRVADAEATEETSEQQGLVAENPSHLAARRLLTVWPVVCADCVGRPFERPPACCRTAPTGS